MSARRARLLAGGLLAAYVVLQVLVVLLVAYEDGDPDELFTLVSVGYAVAGVLVAVRRPGTPIGWLLLVAATAFSVSSLGEVYVADPDNTGAVYVGWLSKLVWHVWLASAAVYLPLLFPTGHLPSRRWRPVAWGLGVAIGLIALVRALRPGDLGLSAPAVNPFGWSGQSATLRALETGELWLLTLVLAVAGMSVALRFRASSGVERQQLKWFAAVALLAAVALIGGVLASVSSSGWGQLLSGIGWGVAVLSVVVGLPWAVAVAVLRHRLFDIDLVIKRTLVYGSLSLLLVATYLALVLVARLVVSPLISDSDLAVAASTLAVAALVRPLRARVQGVVDRRFYRSRYDAARTLDAFAGRLREQLDLDALAADLGQVVRQTMQPAHVSLWLRSAR